MTPKDKAEQLVSNFYSINSKLIIVKNGYDMGDRYNLVMPVSKQCALIAVDEILKVLVDLSDGVFTFIYDVQYWDEVKQEINLL
jgi:hypothetical protein